MIGESVSLAFFIRRQPERKKKRRERENERCSTISTHACIAIVPTMKDPAMNIPIGKIPTLQWLLTWQAEKFTIFNNRRCSLKWLFCPLSCWFSRGVSPFTSTNFLRCQQIYPAWHSIVKREEKEMKGLPDGKLKVKEPWYLKFDIKQVVLVREIYEGNPSKPCLFL